MSSWSFALSAGVTWQATARARQVVGCPTCTIRGRIKIPHHTHRVIKPFQKFGPVAFPSRHLQIATAFTTTGDLQTTIKRCLIHNRHNGECCCCCCSCGNDTAVSPFLSDC